MQWSKYLPRIHPDGIPYIVIFAIVSLILGSILTSLGWVGFILTAWCIYFFRDPIRVVPQSPSLVVSPADGVVQDIVETTAPEELGFGEQMFTRVSIFLNVFNVHVNRVPISGTITKLLYNPGRFFNAELDKASIYNERQSVVLNTNYENKTLITVQIAGLIARRIVCNLIENQSVEGGERFGIIRFGSRVDIYLPIGTPVLVAKGQLAVGGESIIADLASTEPAIPTKPI